MRILLLGANGQVGWELQRALAPFGELLALDRRGRDGLCGDLSRPPALAETVASYAPEIIVNAAAYTVVDKAEAEARLARTVNSLAPAALAAKAHDIDALLVHYSTDYVFDGTGEKAWTEEDTAAPVNVYGQTKWEGEQAVRESGCRHLIIRTSWVYAARGQNFLRSILRLAAERESLRVVNDQIGAPTGAELIADVTAATLRELRYGRGEAGTYHVAPGGETSWYDYARFIVRQARLFGQTLSMTADAISPIPTEDYPTPAPRPRNSRLDCEKFERAFALQLPDWQAGVARVVNELASRT